MGLHFTYMVLRRREVGRVPVYDDAGKASGEIELPPVFGFPLRKDIILRAYLSAFTARLQPQGRDPLAGKRTTARSFGVGIRHSQGPEDTRDRQGGVHRLGGGWDGHAPSPRGKEDTRGGEQEGEVVRDS